MRLSTAALVAASLLVAVPAAAQKISKNPNPPTVPSGGAVPKAVGPASITQSTSLTPVTGSVACNSGGRHTDNSYWRAFTLSSFPALDSTFFVVDSVDIGVEQATATTPPQPITIRLYKNTGAAFPGGTLNLVSTTATTVANQALTLLNIPISPAVAFTNATDVLVLEVFTPNGQAAGNAFFIGSNAAGQSAPSYISAVDCGISTPTDLASISFPNMHIVMRVNGQNQTTPVSLQKLTVE